MIQRKNIIIKNIKQSSFVLKVQNRLTPVRRIFHPSIKHNVHNLINTLSRKMSINLRIDQAEQ